MLRRLERARPWNCSEYVCLTCRHKLWAAQNQQRRRKSDKPPSRPSVDSWEDNFNNLDTGLYTSKPADQKEDDAPPIQTRRDEGKDGRSKRLARRERLTAKKVESPRDTDTMAKLRATLDARVKKSSGDPDADAPGEAESDAKAGGEGSKEQTENDTKSTKEQVMRAQRAQIDDIVERLRQGSSAGVAQVPETNERRDLRRAGRAQWKGKPRDGVEGEGETAQPDYEWSPFTAPFENTPRAKHIQRVKDNPDAETYVKDPDAVSAVQALAKARTSEAVSDSKEASGAPPSDDSGDAVDAASATPDAGKGVKQQSAARATTSAWLREKLLPKSWSSQTDNTQQSEQTSVSAKQVKEAVLPFGAQTSESGSAEVRAPGSINLTVPSPSFGGNKAKGEATTVLAKLHKGWNLPEDLDEWSAAESAKKTPTKKPTKSQKQKPAEKQPEVSKKATRRERLTQASTGKGKSVTKATGDEEATKVREIQSKPPSDVRIRPIRSDEKNAAGGVLHVEESAAEQTPPEQTNDTKSGPEAPPNHQIIEARDLVIEPLDIPQPAVPALEYGLDRVLFNPGVYQLQDPHSRVYNFDPYLQKIMPVVEFDFNALKEYKTSSQDVALAELAKANGKRYIGSTSSMTGTLGHFHYLLSAFRPLNLSMLSKGFPESLDTFTAINRAPNAIFLRWKNGTYAIDADKEFDTANVLMMLGKSMEKLLTLPTAEYERYRKSDPRLVSEEERQAPESFQYTTMGDFLMRSQLDAYDPRLPGTGMFDLKTRAVISVRHNTGDFEPMTGYQIHTLQGKFESYEREYYDMLRSTMLKYMLQVRMGRMDGIFIAYHNVERIFGFQYISLQDMDRALHGQLDICLGDQEFKVSLDMLNRVFDMATAKFPEQSLRFHFEAAQEPLKTGEATVLWAYAEPMAEDQIDRIQSSSKARVAEFEREMMGIETEEKSEDGVGAAETLATAAEADESSSETSSDGASSSTASSEASTTASSTASSGNNTSDDLAPLFAASILLQSQVNGIPVVRPENLRPFNKWTVEYIIQEQDVTPKMWTRYEQTKARRKDLFEKFMDEDDASDDPEALKTKTEQRKEKKQKGYVEFMRAMSKQGREFREKADEAEAGREPVVYGRPVGSGGEGVEGVEGYMEWLYRRK